MGHEGQSDCYVINTSLPAYLASLLAYKRFRDQWPALQEFRPKEDDYSDYPRYQALAEPIHAELLRDLEAADPDEFKGGFWEAHAWNEAILLEIPCGPLDPNS